MSWHRMDADTAETMAGVVRLLRRAAQVIWEAVDVEGGGSPRQILALGIDLAADQAQNLVPEALQIDGLVKVGDEPPSLLRSAEQLLRRVATPGAWIGLHCLQALAVDLVWEANTGSAADHTANQQAAECPRHPARKPHWLCREGPDQPPQEGR